MYAAAIGAGVSALGGSGVMGGGSSKPKMTSSQSDVFGNEWGFGDFNYKSTVSGNENPDYVTPIVIGAAIIGAALIFAKR